MKLKLEAPLRVPENTMPGEEAISLPFLQEHGLQIDDKGYVKLPPGEYELESRDLVAGRTLFIKGTRIGAHHTWWESRVPPEAFS